MNTSNTQWFLWSGNSFYNLAHITYMELREDGRVSVKMTDGNYWTMELNDAHILDHFEIENIIGRTAEERETHGISKDTK